MSMIICNYCGAEVTSQAIEAEDGHCPECGAIIIMRSGNFDDDENMDEEFGYEDEFENEEEDLFMDEDGFEDEDKE